MVLCVFIRSLREGILKGPSMCGFGHMVGFKV